MSRSFRIFGKKRGHRHSRSKLWGSAGEAFFFVVLLVAGTAFLVLLLVNRVVPEWRANYDFVEHTALVTDKEVARVDKGGATAYRPQIKIHYRVDDRDYDVWTYDVIGTSYAQHADAQEIVDRVELWRQYKCWYDPLDPNRVVLARGFTWWYWMLLLVPAGFILIGGAGLVYTLWHWGKSPERLAAQGRIAQLDLFEEIDASTKRYPAVPSDANIIDSPGTRLKYRLPMNATEGWQLFAATTTCVIWNGIVIVFVVIAIGKHFQRRPDWMLDLFILPISAIGGFLVYYLVRELLIATGVGTTQLEISDHPLWPGQNYELHVSQTGHLTINALDVSLECEEVATYRQGTDTRTERCVVFRERLFHQERFEIVPASPFESLCVLRVPPRTMHSFKAHNNEVRWKLVVRGDAEGWPKFERTFPVVVYPPPHVIELEKATNGHTENRIVLS